MPIVERFATPAYLTDLDTIPGQRHEWHRAVSNWFDESIKEDSPRVTPGPFQFYNPARFDPGGLVIEQAVTWNAFPKELLRRFGRERALQEADSLWKLERYFSTLLDEKVDARKYPELFTNYFRPQNEYCEWRVTPGPGKRGIRKVTFTSEPPEFWFALAGNRLPDDPAKYDFKGDRAIMLKLYERFVGRRVKRGDLNALRDITSPVGRFAVKNEYNVYNRWNTTDGIIHLSAPPNYLTAEIQLGADATILRNNALGRILVEPDALVCCARYGGPDRNSDPTIGAAVNAAARLGAFITLKDPVGLYMDHIDLSGWEAPDKKGVADCIHIMRGMPGMIERMEVEVPHQRGFMLSDIRIGGVPIAYGGQIAECITVKLIGVANLPQKPLRNAPVSCDGRCGINPRQPLALGRSYKMAEPLPAGRIEAFARQGVAETPAAAAQKIPQIQTGAVNPVRIRRRMH